MFSVLLLQCKCSKDTLICKDLSTANELCQCSATAYDLEEVTEQNALLGHTLDSQAPLDTGSNVAWQA